MLSLLETICEIQPVCTPIQPDAEAHLSEVNGTNCMLKIMHML